MAVQPTISKFFKSISRNESTSSDNANEQTIRHGTDYQFSEEDNGKDETGDIKVSDMHGKSLGCARKRTLSVGCKNLEEYDVPSNVPQTMEERKDEEGPESADIRPKKTKVSSSKSPKARSSLTPLDQQVKELKLRNLDKLLVVRVGYKYKCFAQDAVIASRILHIKLVPGKLTLDDSNPQDLEHKQLAYCSFPDARLNVHLVRLVRQNLKVGVVEQVETSALKKYSTESVKNSVFERKVTSTLSKATYGINNTFDLDKKRVLGDTSSIWALHVEQKNHCYQYWLVSVDLNNGEVVYDQFHESLQTMSQLELRMKHLEPVELIVHESLPEPIVRSFQKANSQSVRIEKRNEEIIPQLEKVKNNVDLPTESLKLLSILYGYLKDYQNDHLLLISSNYKPFISKSHMLLNYNALKSLDIFTNNGGKGSLFWVLDHTRTAFGFRQLREWIGKPLLSRVDIENRLDAIECVKDEISKLFFESFNQLLKNTPDLLRTLNRISYGSTSRKEIYYFLKQLSLFSKHFEMHTEYLQSEVYSNSGTIYQKSNLLASLLREMADFFQNSQVPYLLSMINVSAVLERDKEKYVTEFFNLNNYDNSEVIVQRQREIGAVQDELNEELYRIQKVLQRPYLKYKDEVEYLIEVRNSQLKSLPSDWVKVNNTKMVSRFHTPNTIKLVERLQYHKDMLFNEANDEYNRFLEKIKQEYQPLKKFICNVGIYDCILSLAATSCNTNYVRPLFTEKKCFIKATNARNPVIESLDVNYVTNDINMSEKEGKVLIITGPNMGGKSSYVRQVALLVMLAQIGSFVPADHLELGIFDNIFTRIGAYDNLLRGESTFKVEMLEVLQIIKNCTNDSLLLLDEVGRGTSTEDGKAIAFTILQYFLTQEKCPLVLFTTHYSMSGLPNTSILRHYHMDFVEEKRPGENWPSVVFLYKLKEGAAHNSYGLNVARLANLDRRIINRAYEISENMRKDYERIESFELVWEIKRILSDSATSPNEKVAELTGLNAMGLL
ncbi:related to DNA mismatch repair protein MSH3 [Zygosaccharomyces bailii]|nr:related to DNA mismatch repair protein MSH3 [Zygosaccharomyces bailii]